MRVHTSSLALAAAPEGRGLGAEDMLLKGLGLTTAACHHLLTQSGLMFVDPVPKKSLQPRSGFGTGCAPT